MNGQRIRASVLAAVMLLSAVAFAGPVAAAGDTDVEYGSSTVNVTAGQTTTVDVVVTNANGGVGTYDLNASVVNGSVAQITDVSLEGNPDLERVIWGSNNESVQVVGISADTDDSGQVTIATITVEGQAPGRTDLDLTVDTLADEGNTNYNVQNTPGATVAVDAPVQIPTLPGATGPATDPDTDGQYEDLTGDATFDAVDVTFMLDLLLRASPPPELVTNPQFFDFNGDTTVDTVDVTALLDELLP